MGTVKFAPPAARVTSAEILKIAEKSLGADHIQAAHTLNSLAWT